MSALLLEETMSSVLVHYCMPCQKVEVNLSISQTARMTHSLIPQTWLMHGRGPPVPISDIRIASPDTRKDLPTGETGLLLVRGPQVMKGYYGDEGTCGEIRSVWLIGFLSCHEESN